jgi:hypothetical protein
MDGNEQPGDYCSPPGNDMPATTRFVKRKGPARFVTSVTAHQAAVTTRGVTTGAVADAVVAEIAAAAFAAPAIVVADVAAAVVALGTLPLVERYVRAARVVMLQDTANETEGVRQPALLQRPADRHRGIAGAKGAVLDVRVSDALVGGGRMGIESDDVEAGNVGLCSSRSQ